MSSAGERDDEDADLSALNNQPDGGASGLSPQRGAPIDNTGGDYDVVEVDHDGEVIGGPRNDGGGAEGRLSEAEAGPRPLVDAGDQQQRPWSKEPKSSRNQRRRESRDRTETRLQFLERTIEEQRQQLDQRIQPFESRVLELGVDRIRDRSTQLEQQMSSQRSANDRARAAFVTAMQSGDHEAATAAMDQRESGLIAFARLENEKRTVDQALERAQRGETETGERRGADAEAGRRPAPAGNRPAAPAPLGPNAQRYMRAFQQQYPGYNPGDQSDPDSAIVLALDNQVFKDRYDPETPEYWSELEDRMRERLPHWFEDDQQQRPQPNGRQPARQQQQPAPQQRQAQQPARRGPPTAGPGESRAPAGARQQVKISPDRKDAMIQSGVIGSDGTVLNRDKYNRQLAYYAKFDAGQTG